MGYEHLIITPAEYSVAWTINGHVHTLNTLESVDTSIDIEEKKCYFIGSGEVEANPRNNKNYSGSMNLQAGELSAILTAENVNDSTDIVGATLAIIGINTDNADFKRIIKNQKINSEKLSVRSADKDTIVPLTFTALRIEKQ
jgi:hypothetical protein